MKKQSEGLWANIWAKRRAGKKMRKKGEKGAPTPDAIRSAQGKTEDTTTANIPNPANTAMDLVLNRSMSQIVEEKRVKSLCC